jgi:hypothetical protein
MSGAASNKAERRGTFNGELIFSPGESERRRLGEALRRSRFAKNSVQTLGRLLLGAKAVDAEFD